MPSHTDPSIAQIIDAETRLTQQFDKLQRDLADDLRANFARRISLPTVVSATDIVYQGFATKYPSDINRSEFINGANNLLPAEYRTTPLQNLVSAVVDRQMAYLNGASVQDVDWWSYGRTIGSARTYVSAGAAVMRCVGPQWRPLQEFITAALVIAVWSPAAPYPGYPEPVDVDGYWVSNGASR